MGRAPIHAGEMLGRVQSAALVGVDALPVDAEVDVSSGLPAFAIAGLGDASEQDAKERIRAAVRNSHREVPARRIVVNLAPAAIRKEGAAYDLPIALGLLLATGQLPPGALNGDVVVGELALDGRVRPIPGVLAVALLSRSQRARRLLVPEGNAAEAAAVGGVDVLPIGTLAEAIQVLEGRRPPRAVVPPVDAAPGPEETDFQDVKGQAHAKRALLLAAAGGHHVLLIGPPGGGKTMLARRLPTILPPLEPDEALEATKIHSVAGLIPPGRGLLRHRPFRAPHHSASCNAVVGGGGGLPRPGEISLAHHGVLFLDELAEFHRDVLEALRQPVEEGAIAIARVQTTVLLPARFLLVAAMNPCPCGHFGDPQRLCLCTPPQIERYRGRISGPLLDRFDLHVEVPRLTPAEIVAAPAGQSTAAMRREVLAARARQRRRFARARVTSNAHLAGRPLRRFCDLDPAGAALLRQALERLALSARAYDRVLRVARTIADLADAGGISAAHVAEAIQYRALDRPAAAMVSPSGRLDSL
jgi:magnesium chelatase family protein